MMGGITSMARRVVLLSLDWMRDKDPRVPLGHACLLAALQTAGRVRVDPLQFTVNAAGFSVSKVVEAVEAATGPGGGEDVDLCVGVYVWAERAVQELLGRLRGRGFQGRIVLGGPQISYCDGGLEELYPHGDVFIRGYAEQALVKVTATSDRVGLPGVHYAGDQDQGDRAAIDMTQAPSPFLTDAVPLVGVGGAPQRFVRWETKRGCPYRCTFCQHREAGILPMAYRGLDEERLRREAELFVAAGVEDVAVLDPIFNIKPNHLEVLRLLKKAGYRGRLSLQCRAELVDEAFLDALDGLDAVLEFGLQTIHEAEGRAVRRMNKVDRVDQTLREVRRRGIPHEVSLIYGLPLQTLRSFCESVDFCLRRRVPVVKAFPLLILRGTELDRRREEWALVENDEVIPEVVGSSTFGYLDWLTMRAISERLQRTEGAHPGSIEELVEDLVVSGGGTVPGLGAGTLEVRP